MAPLVGLDHVVVVVRDLERALAGVGAARVHATSRSVDDDAGHFGQVHHVARRLYRTAACLAQGRPTTSRRARKIGAFLESTTEGIYGVAWATSDAERARTALSAVGVDSLPTECHMRRFLTPDGEGELTFRIVCLCNSIGTEGGASFVCEHRSANLLWQPRVGAPSKRGAPVGACHGRWHQRVGACLSRGVR